MPCWKECSDLGLGISDWGRREVEGKKVRRLEGKKVGRWEDEKVGRLDRIRKWECGMRKKLKVRS
jgi:hypothetical protein